MIIADRLHLLAIQAVRRIEVMSMDPVESIRRALVYATTSHDRLAYLHAPLTKSEAATVLAMGDGPMGLRDIANALGIEVDATYHRLVRLKARGVVVRPRVGFWQVNQVAPAQPPRANGRPRTLPDTPEQERRRARANARYKDLRR